MKGRAQSSHYNANDSHVPYSLPREQLEISSLGPSGILTCDLPHCSQELQTHDHVASKLILIYWWWIIIYIIRRDIHKYVLYYSILLVRQHTLYIFIINH